MIIEVAQSGQFTIIQDLANSIWPIAYSNILSEAQLNYMLTSFYSLDALQKQQQEKNQVFLLCKTDDRYVGFCSYELHADSTKSKTKLHKLYVLQETQGKGFGKALLEEVFKIAKKNNEQAVFLNVNRFNKAKYFYQKAGFSVQYEEDIDIGHGYLMEDFVMEVKI